jgi:predicted glycosyltransferase
MKRIAFFVHDGAGLGHLRRMARIAETLQGPCASLIITGHRTVGWVLSEACDFVHVPSWDGLLEARSRRRGRELWLRVNLEEARVLRRRIIDATVDAFRPDAIFMDYLPFGRDNEIEELIIVHPAKKYLVLRGLIDTIDLASFAEWCPAIARTFDRVFVAADPRIVDVTAEYGLDAMREKMEYVGYVTPADSVPREEMRRRRGLDDDTRWVVCSAGGGLDGEEILRCCLELPSQFENVVFDIVAGPRSRLTVANIANEHRTRVLQDCAELPQLHSAADIVITCGGYNSLIEAMHGGAYVISCPISTRSNDEQRAHARRLANYYPMTVVDHPNLLVDALAEVLRQNPTRPPFPFRTAGAERIRTVILSDLESG